jgi:hypothetical protein
MGFSKCSGDVNGIQTRLQDPRQVNVSKRVRSRHFNSIHNQTLILVQRVFSYSARNPATVSPSSVVHRNNLDRELTIL